MREDLNRAVTQPAEDVVSFNGERQPTLVSTVVETDFAELDDGSLVEMVEDPENSSRTLLAIYNDERFASRADFSTETMCSYRFPGTAASSDMWAASTVRSLLRQTP